MKYKDLPPQKILNKLIATSFESPTNNRMVYDWAESVSKHCKFLESERVKLVQKHGVEKETGVFAVPQDNFNEFAKDFNSILNMEINEKVDSCPVKEDWFDDDKCQYPKEKELWISPAEIKMIVKKKEG